MDMVLFRLVDMGFNRMFSDLLFRYTGPKGGHGVE